MALEDPQLIAESVIPSLPPASDPRPSVSTPIFDAKAMVEATRHKVTNPVYGQMPTGTPEGRDAADAARAMMRRRRRHHRILGWVMAIVCVGIAAGIGYVLYTMYQDDQADRSAPQAVSPAATR
jgi:hypothetical protein